MQYLLLIYDAENSGPKPGTPEFDDFIQSYGKLSEEVKQKGIMLSANALDGVSTATTVRVRNGEVRTTDGPFAETKEQLGGYYLLDCKDLDEAIEYAAKIPSAVFGSVEVRPIKVFE